MIDTHPLYHVTHFHKGGIGNPPPPPKPPAPEDAAATAADNLRSLRKRRGYESTVLTSGLGDPNGASNVKTLLGAQ